MAYLREPKPQKLLDLHDASASLFVLLRESFEVPMHHMLVLDSVDSALHDLRRTRDIAAVTMRKVQALRGCGNSRNPVRAPACGAAHSGGTARHRTRPYPGAGPNPDSPVQPIPAGTWGDGIMASPPMSCSTR